MKDEDYIEHLLVASTHDTVLCFTSLGKVYWIKGYDLPQAGRAVLGQRIHENKAREPAARQLQRLANRLDLFRHARKNNRARNLIALQFREPHVKVRPHFALGQLYFRARGQIGEHIFHLVVGVLQARECGKKIVREEMQVSVAECHGGVVIG